MLNKFCLIVLLMLVSLLNAQAGLGGTLKLSADSTQLISLYQSIKTDVSNARYDSVEIKLARLNNLSAENSSDSLYTFIFSNIGSLFLNVDNIDATGLRLAEYSFQNSQKLVQNKWGDSSRNYAAVIISYANFLMNKKHDYTLSYDLFLQSLNIRRSILGDNNLKTANSYRNVGLPFYVSKDYAKALPWFLNAWKVFNNDTLVTDQSYSDLTQNLGYAYCQLKKTDSAAFFFDRYIAAKQRKYGVASREAINGICYCASVFRNTDNFEMSRDYYRKTLPLRSKLYSVRSSQITERIIELLDSINKDSLNISYSICKVTDRPYTYRELDSIIFHNSAANNSKWIIAEKDAALSESSDSIFGISMVLLADWFGGQIFAPISKYCEDIGLSIINKYSYHNRQIISDDKYDPITLCLPIGHITRIEHAEFSPDGKYIVTVAGDDMIKIWEVHTERVLYTFYGSSKAAHFSPDGAHVIVANSDKAIIYNMLDGSIDKILDQRNGVNIESVKYSSDGKYILTTIKGKIYGAKIWEAASGHLLHSLYGHKNFLHHAEFSNDNKYVFTASEDSNVIVWEVATGNKYRIFKHRGSVNDAAFSADNRYLAAAEDHGMVDIWDLNTGKNVNNLALDTFHVYHISFSPNGKQVAVASQNGTIRLWSPFDHNELITILAHTDWIYSLNFDHTGDKLLSASYDKAKIWDTKSGILLRSYSCPKTSLTSALFSKDDRFIVSPNSNGSTTIWASSDTSVLHTMKSHVLLTNSMYFSHNGELAISSSNDASSKIWNLKTGRIVHNYTTNSSDIRDAYFIGDKQVYLVDSGGIEIWDSTSMAGYYPRPQGFERIWWGEHSKNEAKLLVIASQRKGRFDYNNGIMATWDLKTRTWGKPMQLKSESYPTAHLSYDGKWIVTSVEEKGQAKCKIFDAETGALLDSIMESGYVAHVGFNRTGNLIVTARGKVWDIKSHKVVLTLQDFQEGCLSVEFSDDKIIKGLFDNGTVGLWNSETGELTHKFSGNGMACTAIISPDGKQILITYINSLSTMWDIESEKELYSFIPIDQGEMVLGNDRYYMCEKNAGKRLYYKKGNKTIGFDQLDVKYHRPDKVLQALGNASNKPDTVLISSYNRAWQKRVSKLGIDTTSFEDGFSSPESDFLNRSDVTYEQAKDKLKLKISGLDNIYKLDRYNVWINDVPIFGMRGVNIRRDGLHKVQKEITVLLDSGENKIETSVTNVNGIESYRIPLYVKYTPPKSTPKKLYFVGIGINRFKDPSHPLQWCVKDIHDLADSLGKRYGKNIEIDTLFDQQVNVESVKAIKKHLLNSNVDDKVIIAYSGHGLVSKDYDYYLSTYDVNFSNPAQGGLPYEDLEGLLDSIPARQKLMLIDACHSGELDKTELRKIDSTLTAYDEKPRQGGKGIVLSKKVVGLNNSFELMQELFANVGRGTGATIISAAAGTQLAGEDSKIANGYFTHSILELMQQKDKAKVSELKGYVSKRVTELSHGLQKPTSRNENIDND